jgi:hypothetical protein
MTVARSIAPICALLAVAAACSGASKPAETGAGPAETSSPTATPPTTPPDVPVGALVVSEIMPDPLMVDGDFGEWFELHNPGASPIDLYGLTVGDGSGDSFMVDSHLEVPAGGYVVLGRTTDSALNGGAPVDLAYGDAFKLGNDDDTVAVWAGDVVVDEVTYDIGAGFRLIEGASLSLAPEASSASGNDDGAAWCPATAPYGLGDLGTPGAANGVCVAEELPADRLVPGDLVITELMADPLMVDGDFGEWFELYNASAGTVDLDGLVVRDSGGDAYVVTGALEVAAGGVVVFAASDDPAVNGGVVAQRAFGDALKLGNDADAIELVTPSGTLLDAVAYDVKTFPTAEGAARSLDPSAFDPASNDAGAAWCLATEAYGDGDLGTPGALNPSCGPERIGVDALLPGDLVVTEIMKDPTVGEFGEWFELWNTTEAEVDLSGLTVRDDDDEAFVVDGSLVMAPGGYVVFGASDVSADNGGAPVDGVWPKGAMRLGNGDDELVLEFAGAELDAVRYDDGDTFPDPEGASMSLDPGAEASNEDGGNWCEASASYGDGDLGTPGLVNDPC